MKNLHWFLQNTIVTILLLLLLVFALKLFRREYWRLAYREFRQRKGAVICAWILAAYTLVAVLDSVGWRRPLLDVDGKIRRDGMEHIVYDNGRSALDYLLTPLRTRQEKTYSAPLSAVQFTSETRLDDNGVPQRYHPELRYPHQHLMGTDRVGTDVIYMSLKSIRTGLIVGILATLVAIPFALVAGLSAGYYGGRVDEIVQFIYTVISSIPTVLFVAAFMIIFGQGLGTLCSAMGIASWTTLCRLIRGETLKLRETEYVQAAKMLGQPGRRIIMRHILPNLLHVIIITTVLRFSNEVLAEAALTYLGIGVSADTMSWGTMINEARMELTREPIIWWKLVSAFIFMLGLVLPANIFADALRDALDPKLRTQD